MSFMGATGTRVLDFLVVYWVTRPEWVLPYWLFVGKCNATDPPLVLHLPTSWWPAHSRSCPHILLQRWGCRDSNSCSQNICESDALPTELNRDFVLSDILPQIFMSSQTFNFPGCLLQKYYVLIKSYRLNVDVVSVDLMSVVITVFTCNDSVNGLGCHRRKMPTQIYNQLNTSQPLPPRNKWVYSTSTLQIETYLRRSTWIRSHLKNSFFFFLGRGGWGWGCPKMFKKGRFCIIPRPFILFKAKD